VAKKSRSARSDRAPGAEIPSPATTPQTETITLNGFEIVTPTEADAVKKQPDEHAFIVSSPDGVRSQVTVKIDGEAIAFVERMAKRRLDPDNSFWALAAERLLSDYLWDNGRIPPGGKLTLKEIDREQMLTAERWTA
jgi:hypothetical protein